MTNKEFVAQIKKIVESPTVYYSKAGGDWAKWNGSKWQFDCITMPKAVLWGFSFDKTASHGGAKYDSKLDFTTENMMSKFCHEVSTDFSNIEIGELLYTDGHAGIYAGSGKVYECTVAWGVNSAVISDIDSSGNRRRNGVLAGHMWKKHGKLNCLTWEKSTSTDKSEKDVSKSRIHDWQHTAYKCGFYKGTIDGVWGTVSEKALKTGKAYVKKGANNIWVLFAQEVLKYHGFYTGPLDKSFGTYTLNAVKSYQKSRGLTVDGYVGYYTWRKMLGVD